MPVRLLLRRGVAAMQLLVMLLLALPAWCHDLDAAKTAKQPGISASAGAVDAGHDSCPCCPDDDQDSSSDTCATCSYCSLYTPLFSAIGIRYSTTLVSDLVTADPYLRLTDVPLSIFVPPQNLA
jgi:hypothetical protein